MAKSDDARRWRERGFKDALSGREYESCPDDPKEYTQSNVDPWRNYRAGWKIGLAYKKAQAEKNAEKPRVMDGDNPID